MRKEEWDRIFGDAPEEFHNSVNSALNKISEREETKMSKSLFAKKAVIAAAVVAAFGVTAVAASKIAEFEGHTDLRNAVSSIEEIQEMSDDNSIEIDYPAEFLNGYKFDKGYQSENSAYDKEGNVVRKYNSFDIDYTNDGKKISLIAEPIGDIAEMPEGCETVDINGTTVYKYEAEYKIVPPDYEMTEQDKADEASGKYIFSYGSDEVEINVIKQVIWKDGNTLVTLIDIDDSETIDELVKMAEEVINL